MTGSTSCECVADHEYVSGQCEPVCEGNTPVRGSDGLCRAYECGDNDNTDNSGLSDYEADKTLALPSGVCISVDDCVDTSGHGYV